MRRAALRVVPALLLLVGSLTAQAPAATETARVVELQPPFARSGDQAWTIAVPAE